MSAIRHPAYGPPETARMFAAGGAIVAVGVAGLLVPVRDAIGATNVALVLAIVVAGAAMLGGGVAGVITSLAASLSFDYFHTEPYFDLRIDKRDDVVAAILLLLLGGAVGVFASLRNGVRVNAQVQARGAAHLEDVAAVVAAGADLDEAWPVIRLALLDQLELRSCRFEPVPFDHQYPALGARRPHRQSRAPLRARRLRPASRRRRRSRGGQWARPRPAGAAAHPSPRHHPVAAAGGGGAGRPARRGRQPQQPVTRAVLTTRGGSRRPASHI